MDNKEKNNIIKKYNENVPITEIAKEYGVREITIYKRLYRWKKYLRQEIISPLLVNEGGENNGKYRKRKI